MTGRAPSPKGETQTKLPTAKTRWVRGKPKKTTNSDFEKKNVEKKNQKYG